MQRAVNPQTGEVLFLVDNQWVPPSQTAVNPQGAKAYLVGDEWVQDGAQAAPAAQQPVNAQPEVPQEAGKTSNPLMGALGRISELAGSGAEALQRGTEGMRKGMDEALGPLQSKYLTDKAVKERQKSFTETTQKYAKDIGYEPSTQLSDLADNPLKAVPFIAERIITSSPDMAAAAFAFTPYVAARTDEILNERLKNDKRTYDQATVADVSAALAGAFTEATLERFATKGLLKGKTHFGKTPIGRVGGEMAVQGGTEAGEELASYMAESVGTEKGFDPEEAGKRMLEAGIVGAGLGGGARGARELMTKEKPEAAPEAPTQPVEPTPPEPTPAQPIEEPVSPEEKPVPRPPKETVEPVEPTEPVTPAEPIAEPVAAEPVEPEAEPVKPTFREPVQIPKEGDKGTIDGVAIAETPVAELKLSKDVPQFKAAADEEGIVVPLKGKKYERVGTAPIQVWQRLNGDMEVISGRHRFDLAKRTGEQTIPAQIFKEADGFNADMAAIMDAELNIRDEKGTTKDYVNYFKQTGLAKEDYESRGLLDGKTGQRAYAVTNQGSDELVQALNADQISDEAAYQIASAAPNDARLQALGMKLAQDRSITQAVNTMRAAKTIPVVEGETTGDMFGFDDSAMKTAEEMGRIAARRQREISSDLSAIRGTARNPEIAKKYGINVDDEEALKDSIAEMEKRRDAWNNWETNPGLVDEIRKEMSGETPKTKQVRKRPAKKVEAKPELKLEPTKEVTKEEKAAAEKEATAREEKKIADQERDFFGLTPKTPEEGVGQGVQDDMIGASGLTEDQFKKGIDKNSTEPGEPLVLRDVTLNEKDKYTDDANENTDKEQIDYYNGLNDVKSVDPSFNDKDPEKAKVNETLSEQAKKMEDGLKNAKESSISAKEFFEVADRELKAGNISQEVYDDIKAIYEQYPSILEGIRFEVGTNEEKFILGHFEYMARVVRLFKDTSGVTDPETIRHELAHAMEQIMSPKQKAEVVAAWRKALMAASRAETTPEGIAFFAAVAKFLHNPTKQTLREAQFAMPNITYYQYINPSEYWAVNAEPLIKAQLGSGWNRFKTRIKSMYDGLKYFFGDSNFWPGNRVFQQILTGDRLSSRMLINYIQKTKRRNYKGDPAPMATWESRPTDWMEDKRYKFLDKYIDLFRMNTDISAKFGEIADELNTYQKETLSHGRISKAIKDFLNHEGRPLAELMHKYGISQEQMHMYLLARHAKERNEQVAKINPEMPDMGSSLSTEEAEKLMKSFSPVRLKQLQDAAKLVDDMILGTQRLLVESGLETQETIDTWNKTYKYYVPLFRAGLDYSTTGRSSGQGAAVRGSTSKRATGSIKEVEDILESIATERIRAVERAEKSRIGRAMYYMAIKHPNSDFWLPIDRQALGKKEKVKAQLRSMGLEDKAIDNIMEQPKSPKIDKETGLVYYAPDSTVLNSNNVFSVRVDGEDKFIIFNPSDPRAARLVSAMRNMDLPQLEGLWRVSAYITRWFAMVNTQLNPLFGAWNFARDVQGAVLNLSTTDLKGHEKEVFLKTKAALFGIYKDLRTERKTGKPAKGEWSDLWEDFQKHGGQTGYKAQFVDMSKQATVIGTELKRLNRGNVKKVALAVTDWISDYNDAMENAVRLSAYKVALEQGMSNDKAANLAKNLTVNFNRKGSKSQTAGALFAFFNASIQGTNRLYQTLKGPTGFKIMAGGFMLGAVQGAMLALLGFRDDEPPEFVKERNLIIPLALFGIEGKKYVGIPMPLGFNIFPGLGRLSAEAAFHGKASDKFFSMLSLVANSFNPLGSSGLSLQTIAPTPLDPLVSLGTNKDSFGRPIYKEDRATNPQVGFERTRDNTSEAWKFIAEMINAATGGTDYKKGMWSPTGDEISYLAGQITGGLGREVGKIYGSASDFVSGEETAPYKIPVLGKLYGDAESKANVSNRFYANATELAVMEREIKGRKEKQQNVYQFMQENPKSRLVDQVNKVENQIVELNKRKKELNKRGATIAQIKQIEDRKEQLMRHFNDQFDKIK